MGRFISRRKTTDCNVVYGKMEGDMEGKRGMGPGRGDGSLAGGARLAVLLSGDGGGALAANAAPTAASVVARDRRNSCSDCTQGPRSSSWCLPAAALTPPAL